MSLINSVNLIISLENKISTTKQSKKKTTTTIIQCKRCTLANIVKINIHNISKVSQ
jgi:hypothetical protein